MPPPVAAPAVGSRGQRRREQEVKGMETLRTVPSLTTINGQSAETFWTKFDHNGK
jgi:hypothetical protein